MAVFLLKNRRLEENSLFRIEAISQSSLVDVLAFGVAVCYIQLSAFD